MARRLRANSGKSSKHPAGPVIIKKVHPHYIICAECGRTFYRRVGWEDHMRKRHG